MSNSTLSQTIEVLNLINEIGAEELLDLLTAAAAKTVAAEDKVEKKKAAAPAPKKDEKKPDTKKKPAPKKPAVEEEEDEEEGEEGEEGEEEGEEDEEDAPPPAAKKKPFGKAKVKAPVCPFEVGDKVEFFDSDDKAWGYPSTILEIDGTTITVAQLDDDEGTPVEVDVSKDFSDMRAYTAKKKPSKK